VQARRDDLVRHRVEAGGDAPVMGEGRGLHRHADEGGGEQGGIAPRQLARGDRRGDGPLQDLDRVGVWFKGWGGSVEGAAPGEQEGLEQDAVLRVQGRRRRIRASTRSGKGSGRAAASARARP
jgi:hypothetical protein